MLIVQGLASEIYGLYLLVQALCIWAQRLGVRDCVFEFLVQGRGFGFWV
jgi:hypothetical protein